METILRSFSGAGGNAPGSTEFTKIIFTLFPGNVSDEPYEHGQHIYAVFLFRSGSRCRWCRRAVYGDGHDILLRDQHRCFYRDQPESWCQTYEKRFGCCFLCTGNRMFHQFSVKYDSVCPGCSPDVSDESGGKGSRLRCFLFPTLYPFFFSGFRSLRLRCHF